MQSEQTILDSSHRGNYPGSRILALEAAGAAEAPWLPGIPSNEADVPARADSTSSDQTVSEQFVGAFIQYEERYHRAQRQITVKASQESN